MSVAVGLVLAPGCGGAADSPLFAHVPDEAGSALDGGGGNTDARTNAGDSSFADAAKKDAQPLPVDSSVLDHGISCGGGECQVGTQECCRTEFTGGGVTFACVGRGSCLGNNQIAIPCDDAADCTTLGQPGDVCCALAQQGAVFQVACTSAQSCSIPAGANYILCDPNTPDACPTPRTCRSTTSATMPYTVCR
jgi:hypothetical protein